MAEKFDPGADYLEQEQKEFYEGWGFVLRCASYVYIIVTFCVIILHIGGVF